MTLTLQSFVTFKADATYTYKLYTKKVTADPVIVNGVTFESISKVRTDPLFGCAGQVFTAISDTSASPSRLFSKLESARYFG